MSEPRVEMASDDGEKNQWGRRLFYHKQGLKLVVIPKRVIWALCGFLLVPVTILLVQPPPNAPSGPTPFDSGQVVTGNSTVSIPFVGQIGVGTGKSTAPKRYSGPQVIIRPLSDVIPPGTLVRGVLVSGATNGPVRAETTDAVLVNGETVLDKGTAILGVGSSTEERLIVHFKELVTKDGAIQKINAHACDGDDRIPGIKGVKLGQKALKIAGSIGLGFVSGMAEGLQESQVQGGVEIKKPTLQNAALNGTAVAAGEQSKELMNSLKEAKPVIEVKAGTPIYVLFEPVRRRGESQ